jgi:3-hydroxybutyryl-CoA dehydrogenase
VSKPTAISKTEKICVVGAGLMGHALAQVFASQGHQVSLIDSNHEILEEAPNRIRANFKPLFALGLATSEDEESTLALITLCSELKEAVSDVGVVLEAVSEDLPLKQRLFTEIEGYARPDTLLCSNTSAISITLIAEPLAAKDRLVGTHFWNPPHIVPCVEVIRSSYTSDQTFEAAYDLMKQVGKRPVRVLKDVPGFLGNRMQHALWREAISLAQQGIASPEAIDEVAKWSFGLRLPFLGPLETADLAGLDLTRAVHKGLLPHLENTSEPSPILSEKVQGGDLGVKSGRGFHEWPEERVESVIRDRNIFLLKVTQLLLGLDSDHVSGNLGKAEEE